MLHDFYLSIWSQPQANSNIRQIDPAEVSERRRSDRERRGGEEEVGGEGRDIRQAAEGRRRRGRRPISSRLWKVRIMSEPKFDIHITVHTAYSVRGGTAKKLTLLAIDTISDKFN